MIEFTEEIIVGKGNNFLYSDELIYYFNYDKTGLLMYGDNEDFFEWSINKKGIILLKFKDKINYIKLVSRTKNTLATEIYSKIDDKVIKEKNLDFTINEFDDDESENKESYLKNIIKRIKAFDFIDYSLLTLLIVFTFIIINFLTNQIIFIKDFKLSIKAIFIVLFIYYYKEFYLYLTIAISNKIKKVFKI